MVLCLILPSVEHTDMHNHDQLYSFIKKILVPAVTQNRIMYRLPLKTFPEQCTDLPDKSFLCNVVITPMKGSTKCRKQSFAQSPV
jgi:hypothetical protein